MARRAIRVAGALPADVRGALTLRFRTGANIAVGQVPWGLPLEGSVLGGEQPVDVEESTALEEVVQQAAAAARPVIALVREAHRHAWVLDRLRRLAASTSGLVVVEMGWPGPDQLPGATTVWTHGASAANGAALDELLGSDRGARAAVSTSAAPGLTDGRLATDGSGGRR